MRKIMNNIPANPHIVRDFKVGNTRIMIADDYCRDKSREDVEKILQEIARTALEHLTAAANRRMAETGTTDQSVGA